MSDSRVGTTRAVAFFGSTSCAANGSVAIDVLVITRFDVGSTWSRSIGLVNSTASDEVGAIIVPGNDPAGGCGSMRRNWWRQLASDTASPPPTNGTFS